MKFVRRGRIKDDSGEEYSLGLDELKARAAADRIDEAIARLASFPLLDPDPIVETDFDGVVTYLNPSARMAFHNTLSVGNRYTVMEDPVTLIEAAAKSAHGEIVRESLFGGRVYEQHISSVPEIQRVRVHLHDVTERKIRENLKSEFVNIVSHELRTPLAITKEGLCLILDRTAGSITSDQERILTTAKSSIDRLVRLVNDLLDNAKIEAGAVHMNRKMFDLKASVRGVASSFERKLGEKGLEILLSLPEGDVSAYADEDRIVQVLVNLINNAVKFTSNGGIKILLREEENELVCEVADTGTGISADDMTRIFGKFQQLRQGCAAEEGTGLGLVISKGLVEMHGGRIWAKSELGRGSSFFFSLPKLSPEKLLLGFVYDAIKAASKTAGRVSLVFVRIREKGKKQAVAMNDAEKAVKGCLRGSRDVVLPVDDGIAVMLENCDAAACDSVVRRINSSLGKSFSVSVGVAIYPDDAGSEGELVLAASKALSAHC